MGKRSRQQCALHMTPDGGSGSCISNGRDSHHSSIRQWFMMAAVRNYAKVNRANTRRVVVVVVVGRIEQAGGWGAGWSGGIGGGGVGGRKGWMVVVL